MTTDHTNSKPTEPPPLPDGWTKERHEHPQGGWWFACRENPQGECEVSADIFDDGTVTACHVPRNELLALLGLTAPAADVRALIRERATVIELRRQLAEAKKDQQGSWEKAVDRAEIISAQDDEIAGLRAVVDPLRAELATERQRAETAERALTRATAVFDELSEGYLLRAEAAEREVSEWRDAFASIDDFDWAPNPLRPSDLRAYAGGKPTLLERLEASEKRAEAAEAQLSEWVNWFQQRDPAKAYDIIANEHDAIRSARDQWHRDYCQASEERSDYQGKLAASEARRKALREALVVRRRYFVGDSGRCTDCNGKAGPTGAPGWHPCDVCQEIAAIDAALTADSKDTP